ncbi:cytochrome c maturation protein CcmE [Candidatus Pelagibacter sp. RS40]|jgi:cytochrome c-type biogenesis protein CcmE|uniref:cytochrome c maturation protein CcmE n=1 Tax=Candidatus Pelagibacter sp. RS40 TaxID=1977865 RepID=UPI000A15C78B|nr:cytochrome c maturation protein CcmE [Candidatus Pelagibacter sp. RS40]ARJ48993.1 cytochrome c biogenesis protein CcmE [Candidatus Pelagibacter sp. RS40]|tara:strand:- start:158 stop:577 length:420 start_codon:yes stop_codon:yes gene_type:complete
MYGKKVKIRAFFIILVFTSAILITFLVINSLKENVVFFKSPTDINNLNQIESKKIRVGGMVKKNSIEIENKNLKFVITDFKNEIIVTFSGAVPNLFEEGKGVVAEGYLEDKKYLKAEKILAKHDENYMPPEVKEAMQGN